MNKTFILSKPNAIGDVVVALPMATLLKQLQPNCKIIFIGRGYTKDLLNKYQDIDEILDWAEIEKRSLPEQASVIAKCKADAIVHVLPVKAIAKAAKLAKIPMRIGTMSRGYHWLYCNKLVFVSRKKSDLHEAQNDIKLLRPLGAKKLYSLEEIANLYRYKPWNKNQKNNSKFKLILHPKTKGQADGHAREWPIEHFAELIKLLPKDKVQIYITGTEQDGLDVREYLVEPFAEIIDTTGKMSLQELIEFIATADGLIAGSTGPVHLAASFGINTLGLYPPIKPIHAKRWQPVGPKASCLVKNVNCEACRKSFNCQCMRDITAQQVARVIENWQDRRI